MNPTPQIEVSDPSALNDPAVQRELAAFNAALEANPLWAYKPHKKQQAFHSAKVRLRVYFGGSRSGKTCGGVIDDLIQCIDKETVPDHLRRFKRFEPPCRIRIVVPDFGLPLKAIEETILRWCPAFEFKGGSWEAAWSQREHRLSFGNGSFIEVMSYEQDRSKFGGVTRDRIHYDEEPDGEKGQIIREECQIRLTESKGSDEIFTFTPLEGLGWTFDEFEENKGPEVEKNVWLDDKMLVVRASVRDNPAIDPDEIALRYAHLPELRRRAREDGEFLHLEGLVYPMFDKDLHCVNPEWLRSDAGKDHVQRLDLYEVIDPGYNTTAVLFAGFDPENRLLIYDELYLTESASIPENAAERIREKRKAWGVEPKYTLIDPSARNHTLTGAKLNGKMTPDTVEAAYYRAGIRTIRANNDKEGGVFEVMRRLEHRDSEGEPDPLLLIGENCSNLIRETRRYRLKPKDDGSFDVVKREDHGVDCLVEGTLIATERGDIPIEQVEVGERVLTRGGFKSVIDAWSSDDESEVFRLQTTQGEIVGTAGHRVWTENQGFLRMDELRYSDILLVCQRPLNSKVLGSGAIQTPNIAQIACTSRRGTVTRRRGSDAFTRRFGKQLTGPSRRASISTMSMGIPSTTMSPTLSASLPRNTRPSTGLPSEPPQPPATLLKKASRPQRRGIGLRRGEHGTASTVRKSKLIASSMNASAIGAESPMKPRRWGGLGSALTPARLAGAIARGWTTLTGNARSAEIASESTNTGRLKLAHANALAMQPAGRAKVYDLTVADCPEFFANGVLVHNCKRYLCNARPLSPARPSRASGSINKGWLPGTAPAAPTKPAPEPVGPLGRWT